MAPSREGLGLIESELTEFHTFRVVEVGEIKLPSQAKAVGVLKATAPILAFAEDHCYPDPDWAAALIAAHQQGWAAVGPAMRNANPATMLSWAGLFLHYGCCLEPATLQAAECLPWHNTSYKRELLLAYGDELASMLVVESMLLDDLRDKSHRLCFEPAAKTYHVNISLLSSWIGHAFWGGRQFAAIRAEKQKWSLWRRLLYIVGTPLIPFVRLRRTRQIIYRTGKQRELLPRVLPALISGLVPHAIGEMIGYAFGKGNAEQRYSYYEMARIRHLTAKDRQAQSEPALCTDLLAAR